jgi:ribosomal protein S18 acetylase RimI-like enzyme
VSPAVTIRRATADDIAVVAGHRAAMFAEMGLLQPSAVAAMIAETSVYLCDAVPRGEYVGWLACTADDRVVAGAGVQRRRVLPFARPGVEGLDAVGVGRQAIVLNVYTEPTFRRLGLARALMLDLLDWARASGLESIVLHAAPDGRPLYQALGFAATSEMRFMGDLRAWVRPTA